MNLCRVTITGADDRVDPAELAKLSAEFPFVEWGILASSTKSIGLPRYPTLAWMASFRECAIANRLNCALHLCGAWVRLLLLGELDPIVLQLANGFGRIQLNFRDYKTKCEPEPAMEVIRRIRRCSIFQDALQFIFQLDGERGNDHFDNILAAAGNNANLVGLFDASGGNGVQPFEWPSPFYRTNGEFWPHGYAGGLGPDNLAIQIPRIGKAAGDTRVWIDMESGVRAYPASDVFDLDKVRRCLEIASPFFGSCT